MISVREGEPCSYRLMPQGHQGEGLHYVYGISTSTGHNDEARDLGWAKVRDCAALD